MKLNISALSAANKQADFSLKWVDDTHALAVYSNTSAGKVLHFEFDGCTFMTVFSNGRFGFW